MYDERVSLEDLRTFWKGCVAFYKGEPVFVIGVGEGRKGYEAKVKNMKDGNIVVVGLTSDRLDPPDGRLGFVNLNGAVIYTQRRPVRRFMMGINDNNLNQQYLNEHIRYENGEIHRLSTSSIEFYNTLKGIYPSFSEALNQVKTFGGAVAFDRQFAVNEDRSIFYKRHKVGKAGRGAVDKRGIVLDEPFQYLKSVIGGFDYEEAARTSQPA